MLKSDRQGKARAESEVGVVGRMVRLLKEDDGLDSRDEESHGSYLWITGQGGANRMRAYKHIFSNKQP